MSFHCLGFLSLYVFSLFDFYKNRVILLQDKFKYIYTSLKEIKIAD